MARASYHPRPNRGTAYDSTSTFAGHRRFGFRCRSLYKRGKRDASRYYRGPRDQDTCWSDHSNHHHRVIYLNCLPGLLKAKAKLARGLKGSYYGARVSIRPPMPKKARAPALAAAGLLPTPAVHPPGCKSRRVLCPWWCARLFASRASWPRGGQAPCTTVQCRCRRPILGSLHAEDDAWYSLALPATVIIAASTAAVPP